MPATISPAVRLPAACARALGTAVLALSLFVFVLALPPFAFGIWFQTEPVTAGLLACGAAAGLCLLALDLTGHPVALLFGRRHVQILLAFLAWNALVSIAQDFPGRSWFGTPETGEGIFSFLALLLLMLLGMALWPYRLSRRLLAAAAVMAALTLAGLDCLLPWESAWRPAKFAGYAGTVGPPLVLIVLGAWRRFGWRTVGLAALAGLVPIVFSGNKTAIVLSCLAGPVAGLAVALVLRFLPVVRARWYLAWAPIAALVLTCAAIAGAIAYGDYDPLYSVRSRGLLILAAAHGIAERWPALAVGFGWGSYNDILYQHNFVGGVRGFLNGLWDPNWEGIGAGAFHVHDDIFEAVLGGGLAGGLLYLLFFVGLIAGARRRMLGAGAVGWFLITGSLCFWYPFVLCFPFLALAATATTAPFGYLRSSQAYSLGLWQRGVVLVLALILAAGAGMTVLDARAGGDRLAALNRQDQADIPALGAFPPDHGRGGVHLWWLALNDAAFIGGRLASGQPPTEAQALWYGHLLEEVDAWVARGRAGVRLEALTLALRNDLVAGHQNTALAPLRTREIPRWGEAVRRVIGHSPDRTDVAVPYLSYLAANHQLEALTALCASVFALHPGDRVCLWYTGLAMLSDPTTIAAGLSSMHAALLQDVDAVAPVPKAARDMVEANVAPGKP